MVPPHHAFVHAQAQPFVVHALLEDAFPAVILDGEELRLGERIDDLQCVVVVLLAQRRVADQLRKLDQAAGSDGRGRAFVRVLRVLLRPVVGRHTVPGVFSM